MRITQFTFTQDEHVHGSSSDPHIECTIVYDEGKPQLLIESARDFLIKDEDDLIALGEKLKQLLREASDR